MYPAQFDYYKAASVDEALELAETHNGNGQTVEWLAGGHSLLPTMKTGLASPDVLIDIGQITDLKGIDTNGDEVVYGANTRYADIAASQTAWDHTPAVAEAAEAVGDIQVRNRGTIGGNIAHADPASDPPAGVLASDATIHLESQDGERTVPASEFFQGMYATDIQEGELLTRITVPTLTNGTAAYLKKPSPSSGYAMVGVAVVLHTADDTIDEARVAQNGALDHATRLTAVEDALAGQSLDEDAAAAGEHATDGIEDWEFMDDIQASSDYRAQLLRVYTQRAITTAIDRAQT